MRSMIFGALVVCACVLIHTIDAWKFVGKNHFHLKFQKSVTQLQSSYGTLGSDALVRPEDEDSPEFREYLKKLLDMQSNRAKAGFASPSSGSSDAYFAKLTRMKLEKIARRKAGLPEEVDSSYRPEDYLAAVSEMAEPTISNSALLSEAGGGRPGNKVRSLTTEELRLAKAAEEVVQRELMLRSGQTPPPASVELSPGTVVPGTIIEAMNKKSRPAAAQVTVQAAQPQISALPPPQAVIPQLPPDSVPRASIPPPPPVQANPTTVAAAVEVASQPTSKSWSPSAKTVSAPAPAPVIPGKSPAAVTVPTVSKSSSPVVLKRKLTADELAAVGKALEMTVKHRGGGPFGAGRLQGADLELLESSLRSAVQVLREDARLAQPVVEATKTVPRDPLPAIKLPPVAAQTQVPPAEKPAPVTPKAAVVPPPSPPRAAVQQQQLAPPRQAVATPPPSQQMEVDVGAPMPIAMGIDRFLQNPKGLNYEELCGLRDAVIQVLAMIQGEIATSSPAAPLLMPSRPAVNPTDRIVKDYYSAPPSAAADGSTSDEESRLRELKLSLGLLLKHRGGPGFGHGRLEGKELELMESKLRSAAEILREEAYST